jgi:hypothetical protein
MARIYPLSLVLAGLFTSVTLGAGPYRHTTVNFDVTAPTPQMAQQIAEYAEHYRKEKAKDWLGYEMPNWPARCPIHVDVRMDGAGGATTFEYGNGEVLSQSMHIEGAYDRLLNSVLPHEITHTVFAFYFRTPVPRWADEGGSVLSEDEPERERHDRLTRQILNTPRRAIPLKRLFALKEYPDDVMALYAEGFSVTNFLVAQHDRPTFLKFLAHGMQRGWDSAATSFYGFKGGVNELEQAWVESLRAPRRTAPTVLAKNDEPAPAESASRVVVRQTAPPVLAPLDLPQPVGRGPRYDEERPSQSVASRPAVPGYPTSVGGNPTRVSAPNWPGPSGSGGTPAPVQLGFPEPTGR